MLPYRIINEDAFHKEVDHETENFHKPDYIKGIYTKIRRSFNHVDHRDWADRINKVFSFALGNNAPKYGWSSGQGPRFTVEFPAPSGIDRENESQDVPLHIRHVDVSRGDRELWSQNLHWMDLDQLLKYSGAITDKFLNEVPDEWQEAKNSKKEREELRKKMTPGKKLSRRTQT